MLGGKPFSGAAETGLHFVGDEEDTVFAANVLQQLEVIMRRNNKAAFAENGFGDDRGDGFGSDGTLEGVFEMVGKIFDRCSGSVAVGISVGDAINVAGEGLEASFSATAT